MNNILEAFDTILRIARFVTEPFAILLLVGISYMIYERIAQKKWATSHLVFIVFFVVAILIRCLADIESSRYALMLVPLTVYFAVYVIYSPCSRGIIEFILVKLCRLPNVVTVPLCRVLPILLLGGLLTFCLLKDFRVLHGTNYVREVANVILRDAKGSKNIQIVNFKHNDSRFDYYLKRAVNNLTPQEVSKIKLDEWFDDMRSYLSFDGVYVIYEAKNYEIDKLLNSPKSRPIELLARWTTNKKRGEELVVLRYLPPEIIPPSERLDFEDITSYPTENERLIPISPLQYKVAEGKEFNFINPNLAVQPYSWQVNFNEVASDSTVEIGRFPGREDSHFFMSTDVISTIYNNRILQADREYWVEIPVIAKNRAILMVNTYLLDGKGNYFNQKSQGKYLLTPNEDELIVSLPILPSNDPKVEGIRIAIKTYSGTLAFGQIKIFEKKSEK